MGRTPANCEGASARINGRKKGEVANGTIRFRVNTHLDAQRAGSRRSANKKDRRS